MERTHRTRGQTTAEYAIVIGVVIAAIVAMQVYVRRGVNARLKDASDSSLDAVFTGLGKGAPTAANLQYEPYYASSTYTTTQDASAVQAMESGGVFKKRNISETTARTGSQTVGGASAP